MHNEEYKVVKYASKYFKEWNDFILNAKNATFLFHRDFMDYHSDRFQDHSLLIYQKGKLIAVFPANSTGDGVCSHQGLSYGGLVLPQQIHFNQVLEALKALLKYLSQNDIKELIIKLTPKIYHRRPADEMDYLLFILNAKLLRRDISMAIPLNDKLVYSTLRKRQIKKGEKDGLSIKHEKDLTSFWDEILIPNLRDTHGVLPVHSLSEINSLSEKFPDNIKQYNVYAGNEFLAGCTVFETHNVAHLQYISTRKDNNNGSLDYLIHYLISKVYHKMGYFDFGISNENQGRNINLGLLNWKQGFGASSVVHDFYEIDVDNHPMLNKVLQ